MKNFPPALKRIVGNVSNMHTGCKMGPLSSIKRHVLSRVHRLVENLDAQKSSQSIKSSYLLPSHCDRISKRYMDNFIRHSIDFRRAYSMD